MFEAAPAVEARYQPAHNHPELPIVEAVADKHQRAASQCPSDHVRDPVPLCRDAYQKVQIVILCQHQRVNFLIAAKEVLDEGVCWRWLIVGPYRTASAMKTVWRLFRQNRKEALWAYIRGLRDGMIGSSEGTENRASFIRD